MFKRYGALFRVPARPRSALRPFVMRIPIAIYRSGSC